MTNHLQTILNCAAEPITLAQHISESVSVVINKRSLRHDDANIPVGVCPSLHKLRRKNIKPNIDFHFVL